LNALKVYKSSAGSGKTFILVKEYLRLVLANPEDFQHILAITFTNKAAAEMKSRIILALVELSNGKDSPLRNILETELPGTDLIARSGKALRLILHNYSSFSVSTIDSFFQRILRALAREMHLPLRLDVQIGLEDVILEVTDSLLNEAGKDPELTAWLGDLLFQKMAEDKGWDIDKDIKLVAKELFKDQFEDKQILDREKIKKFYASLRKIRLDFEHDMHKTGSMAMNIMKDSGLQVDDFSYKSGGVMGYLRKISNTNLPDDFIPGQRAISALENQEKWYSKDSGRKEDIIMALDSGLYDCLQTAFDIYNTRYEEFLSAFEALKRIYLFGIANDLQKKLSSYRSENNLILLSDTPKMLSSIITGEDAPFIYEKAGNRYKHLLIDEFQDTSQYQWKNLLPLINNTLGSGNMALVVGDAKQSIYRWRGGNMNLLVYHILEDLKHFKDLFKAEFLSTNFRSRKDVVEFNNAFFMAIPEVIRSDTGGNGHPLLETAYSSDLIQNVSGGNELPGYIRIEFLPKQQKDGMEESAEETGWKNISLVKTVEKIKELLSNGYSYGDIAILVRKNSQGNTIAEYLIGQGISQIISPDSLLISAAPRINFLISLMRFLSDPQDNIARTEILYYYSVYRTEEKENDLHRIFTDHPGQKKARRETANNTESGNAHNPDTLLWNYLPDGFISNLAYLSKLPVYELSENLIRIFFKDHGPDAYLQRFQDLVLEFMANHDSSLNGFISWWELSDTVRNCAVLLPENENAIRIMTIHKSKGLQFPVVIMPFADWALAPKSNELFWATSEMQPYNDMGKVALLFSKRLGNTYFKDAYSEELMQTLIDNLNLLYVAFTRAEEQLIIFTAEASEKSMNRVPALIAESLRVMDCPLVENVYERGSPELKKETGKKKEVILSEKLRLYSSSRWQEKIGISSRSGDLLQLRGDKAKEKTNYGILVHRILSEIRYEKDLARSVNKIIADGMLNEYEKPELLAEITSLLQIPGIKMFFSTEWQVRNEREIILPGGRMLRPDRVLIGKSKTIVLDFKTGKELPSHPVQVGEYAQALQQMGYPDVQAYLLYIGSRKLQQVELSESA